jgi:thiosulfate dehydrogenase [quinone] large subunit
MAMPGMSGPAEAGNPALALVLALFMAGYILWTTDQLASGRLGRLAGGTKDNSGTAQLTPTQSASAPSTAPSSSGAGRSHPACTAIGPAKDMPAGGAASFTDPRTGDPSIVIQATPGKFVAFDAVCPHAGCTVEYDQAAALIICPCHGSQFNAATGAVETGPATTGLNPITIAKGSNGQLYAT